MDPFFLLDDLSDLVETNDFVQPSYEQTEFTRQTDVEMLFNEFTAEEFKRHFRMNKDTARFVIDQFVSDKSLRGPYHAKELDILCLLNYLATGSFMFVTSKVISISKSAVHRAIHRALKSVSGKFAEFVHFPNDLESVKRKFQSKYGLPGIIGAIDGTHIPIQKTGGRDSEIYRNRKGFFSINVQAVCGPDNYFYDAVIRWPGSTHDSRIFENSAIYSKLETNQLDGVLLGDSGYPLKRFCITPLRDPATRAEKSNEP